VASHSLFAQAIYGSLAGTITDTTGAVIPDATVTVTDANKGTTQAVTSNGAGNYIVDRLIPDVYAVKAEAPHFSPATSSNITLAADTTPQVNLQLSITAAVTKLAART
jgi:hypothetical protein